MLEFPLPDPPGPGERLSVADGLDWVRQPLPFRLDHVNCWWLDAGSAAADGSRTVLVDTGIASEASRASLDAALDGASPEALLVTHFHPDHSGLAGHFHARGARPLGGEVEMRLSARLHRAEPDVVAGVYADWYRANGLPDGAVAAVAARGNGYRAIVDERPPLDAWTWLDEGDRVALGARRWTVRIGRGHAPRMLMLHDESGAILIAADQVLPSISPNVSLFPEALRPARARTDAGGDADDGGADTVSPPPGERDEDPLGSFLESLDALRALPTDTLVLPSHGRPFRGLHERLDALGAHHQERLARVLDACARPRSAFDLFEVLFAGRLDAQQTSFALGEALAHARRLERLGALEPADGADGVRRFVRA